MWRGLLLAGAALGATLAGAAPRTPASRPPPGAIVLDLGTQPSASTTREALARDADARQFRHDFAGAEAVLTALLARWPRDAGARLARAQARVALGNPRGALADCLAATSVLDALAASACAAQARAALGDKGAALELVERALERGRVAAPPAVRSYAAGIAAELAARSGDPDLAERRHREALAHAGTSHFPLVAYADFLLASGRPADALALLDARGANPALEERIERAARALDGGPAR